MPAQNSRSIVIRGGTHGTGAFFFASAPAAPGRSKERGLEPRPSRASLVYVAERERERPLELTPRERERPLESRKAPGPRSRAPWLRAVAEPPSRWGRWGRRVAEGRWDR